MLVINNYSSDLNSSPDVNIINLDHINRGKNVY
jgi:hypothetical protein